MLKHQVDGEAAMIAVGESIGRQLLSCSQGLTLYLHGDLGAGKTTLTRGILRGLGHKGSVKSPTYTLVEPYELLPLPAYHFDLYRLADPEELEYMGIRDYFHEQAVRIVEWPERGQGILPAPDLQISLSVVGRGRAMALESCSESGQSVEQSILSAITP